MDIENQQIKEAKNRKEKYSPPILSNGDISKQLLARSRYILAKKESQWTENQKQRAQILFAKYPSIQVAYRHVIKLRAIYEEANHLNGLIKLQKWIDETRILDIKQFNSVAKSIENHFDTILNFFYMRSTNANAESFKRNVAPLKN